MRCPGWKTIGLVALLLSAAQGAFAQLGQAPSCQTSLLGFTVPPTVRAEGKAELVGDLVLTCTGGLPTQAGMTVPVSSIQIFLNTDVENAVLPNAFTDALLIIDDPHSVANPNVPLLVCGAAGSNDNGSGQCPNVLGDGTGLNTYNGAAGHPNVFQGQLNGENSLLWSNVPLEFPGGNGVITLRFTNVRANVSQVAGSTPNQITAFVSINGARVVTLNNAQQTVAIWQNGLTATASAPAALQGCGAANTQSAPQFTATLRENFATAFRPKNIAQVLSNAPVNGTFGSGYLTDQNQDIPGVLYNTETGFYDGASDPAPNAVIPTIPTTADFPAIRDLNQAGAAGQGTRVYVMLTSVPTGMTPYVPITVPLLSAETAHLNQQTGVAVLTLTDSSGNGPFVPVTGNAAGLGAMQVSGSSAMAVYEILYSSPADRETIVVPITATYGSGALAGVASSQETGVQVGFAPFGSTALPNFTSTPDFTQTALLYRPCGYPDLTLGMTGVGSFAAGATGTFILTVPNAGNIQTSGAVSVTDTLPQGFTASSLTGPGWNCSLSSSTCTRSDVLAAGSSYPVITLMVNVAAGTTGSLTNTATVAGGDETLTANDTGSTVVNVTPVQSITIGTNLPGLTFIVDGTTYGSTQIFEWAMGSSHSLSLAPEQGLMGTEYLFSGWSDAGAATHSLIVGAGPETFIATFGAPSQVILCNADAGVPAFVRAEGETELTGDLVLNCTGGTPTPSGIAIPQVNLTLTFNGTIFPPPQLAETLTAGDNVTSRITIPGFSEALLLVDEPHSGMTGTASTLLACGDVGSNDNGSGSCSITGDGTGLNTYDGVSGHPNVFQGQILNSNSIVWRNVPIDAPANSGHRTLRFTNLRVNASSLPPSNMQVPSAVIGTVAVTPGGLAVLNAQELLAYAESSLKSQTGGVAVLSACESANPGIAANPNSPLDMGGQNGAQFTITETEGFVSVFTMKNIAEYGDAGPAFLALYPADEKQDLPGYFYNTETRFFNGSSIEPAVGIPPTPEFPSIRGLNTAGSATSGTRVYFRFSPVPAGMQLYVPATLPLFQTGGTPSTQTGIAVLTATDLNGAGPFTPLQGNASGLAAVPISNSVGLAVYEILYANSAALESLSLPVAAAYLANQVLDTVVNVQSGLAPLSTVTTADSVSPIPRFAAIGNVASAFSLNTCTNTPPPFGSFDTPAATSNVSGAVGFTGWALAAAGIASVEVWREPNVNEPAQGNGLVFIGTATIVTGARPDVEGLYPGYPGSNSAGWGFQILTNELPSNSGNSGTGNGNYRIHALAHDSAGKTTDLGVKTIVVDNQDAVTPFGTIDTPGQGGIVSGASFVNFGWALAPMGKTIPSDGSTISVYIDGNPMGHPVYDQYRVDVATAFPGYENSGGAVGYYRIDSTKLTNGLHTISWSVTDDAGVTSGIGSRFFTVQN